MREQCLCGSRQPYSDCCGSYLAGESTAPTAEALMRSRYSAFCQGNIDYLLSTGDPNAAKADERLALTRTVKHTRWLNLLIVKTQQGMPKDKTGIVEFVAAYQPVASLLSLGPAGTPSQLHEKSRFKKVNSCWRYVGGDILLPYRPKPAQLCWCGSRKAFKHCHARAR